ncbi:hypothetical protein AAVH_25107 [Aphelenchoides avenae]|nr:hypothetical protein AAVH_25107 [Aphelenchus avenae]
MRFFVVLLACIVGPASASVDPFEVIPQLEPFKDFLPAWLNSSLYEVDGDELLILKGLITNGTAMSNVTELFEALQANGGGTLSKVLTSAYRRFEAGLEDLPPNTRQFLDEVRRTLRHFLTLIFLKISEDLRKIASEAIEDVDIEAVRKLAIKAVEAYERFVRTVYGGRSDKTRAEVFQDALPGMARFLQDPDFWKIVKQTANVASEAVQG